MARFYRPQKWRQRDNANGYDEPLVPPTSPPSSAVNVSDSAQHTLDNINDVLRQNEENPSLYNPDDSEAAANKGSVSDQLSGAERGAASNESNGDTPSPAGDQVGKGFRGNDPRSRLSSMVNGKSKLKKRLAIAGIAGAGGVLGGALIFTAMLPLKIEHIVTNLQNTFSSTATDATENMAEHLMDRYLINKVLPGIGNACHSTISKDCSLAKKATGKGPVSRLYNVWRENRLENKLATKYNIVLGKKNGRYYLNTNAGSFDLGEHPTSIFDLPEGTTTGTRREIASALSDALKQETLWKRVLFRFRFNKFIAEKYGVKLCITKCLTNSKFAESVATKKLAAKAYIVTRVITPLSQNFGLVMQCMLGGGDFCKTHLENVKAGEPAEDRLSPVQRKLQQQLDSYIAEHGTEKLAKLVEDADKIGKDGFAKYIAKSVGGKLGEKLGIESGEKIGAKAIPVVGWVFTIADAINLGSNIGPMIRYVSYASEAAAAVQLYQMYSTVAAETKSGNIDATELGSFTDALSTNLSGSSDNQVDATQTPLYRALISDTDSNGSPGVALLDSIDPSGVAYADSTGYTCDSGGGVPTGQLVCPEERLDRGNSTASGISNIMSKIKGIPGVSIITTAVQKTENLLGKAIIPAFNFACDYPLYLAGCPLVRDQIGNYAGKFSNWLLDKLVDSPFSNNMSGGRTFDMMAAGADVSYNSACQEELGCAKLNDQQVADIRNEQLAERKADFDNESMFARMFDTSSPYSLVSQLALMMPTSLQSAATTGVASFLTNPLDKVGSAFASIFSGNHAFAATPAMPDPFGVVQYGYTASQIPSDPEQYWQDNCQQHMINGQLDISGWLNSQQQDTNTGEPVATQPNPCMLIQATTEAVGGIFNTGLLPQGSTNP